MFRGAAGAVNDEDCVCVLPPMVNERKKIRFVCETTRFFAMHFLVQEKIPVIPVMIFHVHALPPARS